MATCGLGRDTGRAMTRGATTLSFQAQGFVGGCNTGHVGSWGGKITVTVKVPRR